MASAVNEGTPLMRAERPQSRPQRTVAFSPTVSTGTSDSNPPGIRVPQASTTRGPNDPSLGQPMLSAFNNKLRRRHSHGAPLQSLPTSQKVGAQRTTKHAQKLKLLPNPDQGDEEPDEESGRDVYSQFTRIKDPTARRDAARLGKDDRTRLPRVTAYCTANAYRLDELMKFLRGRGRTRGATPKLFDECIYTPYSYSKNTPFQNADAFDGESNAAAIRPRGNRRYSDSAVEIEEGDATTNTAPHDLSIKDEQLDANTIITTQSVSPQSPDRLQAQAPINPDFDTQVHTSEVFLFNYGTVVIWGMTLQEEERFLKDIAKFETEKLGEDDVQTENFNFYYTQDYQARIYNDFISLREKRHYMTKLAISHALSQSVKVCDWYSKVALYMLIELQTSLYEDLVDNTIETTKEIPSQIATTGKVNLSRKEINMQIGELFILRINIHLQGSVLDSPELMWAEPQLDPIYQAVRSYLEMDQRVGLLTERLDVIADLLAVLKDQLTHTHSETLEWVVIILIAAEILVAAVNIVVDLYAGVD
ncbi:MAG: hypothetical protein M1828_001689 [Chrysothrix sp. TS-e1954]|nr:MAG: hypothetical protein M1828_001689 [Chrysothrix sp. TS-e1954]